MEHPIAKICVMPMGYTSEQVSSRFNITRERMDELAAQSHQRAFAAQQAGKFDAEILPIATLSLPATPNATGATSAERVRGIATADDGIRGDTTKEGLAKIRSAFPQYAAPGKLSTTTGGNASQITDGVAGVLSKSILFFEIVASEVGLIFFSSTFLTLVMTRRKAEELGLPILAKHVATSYAGLSPEIMGIVSEINSPPPLFSSTTSRLRLCILLFILTIDIILIIYNRDQPLRFQKS